MKKFFLFAAAAVAALTVNAKTISFAEIVDKTDATTAKSTFEAAFNLANLTITGKPNGDNTAYYAELKQNDATEAWGVTTAVLKSDAQAWFDFKDANKDKVVAKAYKEYIQPNGKAMALVISNLNIGDQVTINLKDALGKVAVTEGTVESGADFTSTSVTLTAMANEIRIFSKTADNADAKWKLVSVEVGGSQGINDVNAEVKAVKRFENGQLVIIKNGVKYNALGAVVE